jgi:hypothetical protein
MFPHHGPNYSCYSLELFRDGDPFTTMIQQLPHLATARAIIKRNMAACQFQGSVPFHYADMTPDERRQAANDNLKSILTGGLVSMPLAQAFLGLLRVGLEGIRGGQTSREMDRRVPPHQRLDVGVGQTGPGQGAPLCRTC